MLFKNIKNIWIDNGEWSITRNSVIDLNCIIRDLEKLPYTGARRIIDENIEKTQFPAFAKIFYCLIYQFRTIPSENLFFTEYVSWLDSESTGSNTFSYNGRRLSVEGLKSRMLRTYPSLIRELHFYYLLLESNFFDEVKYSLAEDFVDGIDITIIYRQKQYGISIHVNTTRGIEYKEAKRKRHSYANIEEIVLAPPFAELSKIGDFYLLNDSHLQEVLRKTN